MKCHSSSWLVGLLVVWQLIMATAQATQFSKRRVASDENNDLTVTVLDDTTNTPTFSPVTKSPAPHSGSIFLPTEHLVESRMDHPKDTPTIAPSLFPSSNPSQGSSLPSSVSSDVPSGQPTTTLPSAFPSLFPSGTPTESPSGTPTTVGPTKVPLYEVAIDIVPDRYPSEISWYLRRGDTGELLLRGGSKSAAIHLPPETVYSFAMWDDYGDGICCLWGRGSFQVRVAGRVLFTGGRFRRTTGERFFLIQSDGSAVAVSAPTPAPSVAPTTAAPVIPPPDTVVLGLQPSCYTDDPTRFDICLDLVAPDGYDPSWMTYFASAKAKWESVIVGDDEGPYYTGTMSQRGVATNLPLLLDDIYISGIMEEIDGPGGVLGMAAPRVVATKSDGMKRTVTGVMRFDAADVTYLIASNLWEDVVLHEMGHVLGLGPLWDDNDIYNERNPHDKYRGTSAQQEFLNYGFTGVVPVERQGGAATAGGHWSATCLTDQSNLQSELMVGFLTGATMSLSRITIGGLQDLGYEVNFDAADPFDVTPRDCGDRRNLRRGPASSSTKHQRRLSAEAEQAREYGMHVLQEEALESSEEVLEPGETNFAANFVEVLYLENDGSVHGIEVVKEQFPVP